MFGERASEQLDARSDDLLDRLPLLLQGHVARVQARHVEEVADQAGDAFGLVANGDGRFRRNGAKWRPAQGQRIGEADERGQRRAQIVRQRRENRTAQTLRHHLDLRALRDIDVMHALDGNRHQ